MNIQDHATDLNLDIILAGMDTTDNGFQDLPDLPDWDDTIPSHIAQDGDASDMVAAF